MFGRLLVLPGRRVSRSIGQCDLRYWSGGATLRVSVVPEGDARAGRAARVRGAAGGVKRTYVRSPDVYDSTSRCAGSELSDSVPFIYSSPGQRASVVCDSGTWHTDSEDSKPVGERHTHAKTDGERERVDNSGADTRGPSMGHTLHCYADRRARPSRCGSQGLHSDRIRARLTTAAATRGSGSCC